MIKIKVSNKNIKKYIGIVNAMMFLLLSFFSFGINVTTSNIYESSKINLKTLSNVAQDFAGGDGSENNPFLIATPIHLDNVRNYAYKKIIIDNHEYPAPGYNFKVICDIDLEIYLSEGGIGYNQINWGEQGWMPIKLFSGVFDGGGYTIKNFWINRPDDDYIGLFSYCTDCIIENIKLELSNKGIIGKNCVGGIAGKLNNSFRTDKESALIKGCFIKGNIYAVNEAMEKAEFNWNIMSNAGGIVGDLFRAAVEECQFVGSISGLCAIGGIAGISYSSNISDCKVDCEIILTSTSDYIPIADAGGIVGTAFYGAQITNCFYKGIKNDDRVAAIVGYRELIHCNGEISSVFMSLPIITSCYWDNNFDGPLTFIENSVLNEDTSCDGWYYDEVLEKTLFDESRINYIYDTLNVKNSKPLTAMQMKKKANYKGWDFKETWGFDKKGDLALRTFGNVYDKPSLTWLWIILSCTVFSVVAIMSGIILYRRKKIEVIKETISIDKYIEIVKEIPLVKKPLPHDLSIREKQVAELLLKGKSRHEIADEMNLADNTIGTYITRICVKAGVDSIREFVVQYLTEKEI